MAFEAEHCRTWLEQRIGVDDRYLTYVVTQTSTPLKPASPGLNSNISFSGTELIRERADQLGLVDENKVGLFQERTFVALTEQRVFYGNRSAFRDRPKDLLQSSSAQYTVNPDAGPSCCHRRQPDTRRSVAGRL